MKKVLKLAFLVLTSAVLLSGIVTNAAERSYVFDTTYTENTPLKSGNYNLQLNQSADNTLYVFKPDEIGIYELKVNSDATIGWWGAYPNGYLRNPGSTSNVIQREIKKVGDVAVIGISSKTPSITLSIEKVGESQGIVEIDYTDYVNEHTPAKGIYPTDEALEAIDVSKPHTAVLHSDGSYRLDSESGPVIYVDLVTSQFSLVNAYGSYGALAMRGICDGVYYNFKSAMKEYNDVIYGTSGVYPLTIDLMRFIKSYGTSQMWFIPEYSPFDDIQKGTADADTAWMALCLTEPASSGSSPDVNVRDTDISTPYIIDFVTGTQVSGTPIIYNIGNSIGNSVINVKGSGTFTVQYSGTVYTSANGEITIENIKKDALIKIDGNGVFALSVDMHAVCEKIRVPAHAPTCTENGQREYYYCSICECKYSSTDADAKVLSDEELTVKAAHSFGAYYKNENGQLIRKCQNCNAQQLAPANVENNTGSSGTSDTDNSFFGMIAQFFEALFQSIADFFANLFKF